MVRCPTRDDLERFLDGSLPEPERRGVAAHTDDCPACRAWLEEASSDDALLPDVQRVAAGHPDLADAERAGRVPALARYELLGRLGEGGMGVVYEAVQRGTERRVALKLLKAMAFSGRSRERFEREARVLGRLAHPGIAQVLEADTFEMDGVPRPFFAMELVRGAPLTEHAERAALTTRARLGLVAQVCDAVQHAHEQGIVHRDLKPANVLVGADGRPKVLDFGVARALGEEAERTGLTAEGQLVGTLAYMSPEQVSGNPTRVDARSDVYALGVMLYELLAGRAPHPLAGRSLPEAARVIAEVEPVPLRAVLPGSDVDLETVVGKALEKDPARRYGSAAALAADLRRYLTHEPIEARPPTTLYRLHKFVRRNRTLVGGLALTFVTLLAGILGTGWQMLRARTAEAEALEQKEEAQVEAQTAERANEFLVAILSPSESAPERGPDFTVREALEEVERRLDDGELEDAPKVKAAVLQSVGNAYRQRGQLDRAIAITEEVVRLREEHYGPRHYKTAAALNSLGVLRAEHGEHGEAVRLLRRALDVYGQPTDPQLCNFLGTTLLNLASILQGADRLDEAEALLEQGAALHDEHLTGRDRDRYGAWALQLRASLLDRRGRPEEAEASLLEAIEAMRRLPTSTRLAQLLTHMGGRRMKDGRHADAVPLFREAAAIWAELRGPAHPDTLNARSNLGCVLDRIGATEEAEAVFRAVLAAQSPDPDAQDERGESAFGLARLLLDRGDLDGAEEHARLSLALWTALRSAKAATARAELVEVLVEQGRFDEAVGTVDRGGSDLDHVEQERPDYVGGFWLARGRALMVVGRYEEADAAFARAVELQELHHGRGPRWREALEGRVELAELWERPALAQELRDQLAAGAGR